jgi:hypothetical protein
MPQMAKDVSMARFIAFTPVAVKPQNWLKMPVCRKTGASERFY